MTKKIDFTSSLNGRGLSSSGMGGLYFFVGLAGERIEPSALKDWILSGASPPTRGIWDDTAVWDDGENWLD